MTFDSFGQEISKEEYAIFVRLLSPFCPHSAEELWEKIGGNGFASLASWPIADTTKINPLYDAIDKAVESSVGDILNITRLIEEKQGKKSTAVYLYTLPQELANYDVGLISNRIGIPVKAFAVNDPNKYDPSTKASKAKPGKPAIYVE